MSDLIDASAIARQAIALKGHPETVRHAMANALRSKIGELDTQLSRQFDWLGKNQGDARWLEFYDRWHADLKHYERACDALANAPTATQGRLTA